MAVGNQDLPWDDQTELFMQELDELTKANNGMSIRNLLLNPNKYNDDGELQAKLPALQATVDSYFNDMLNGLTNEQRELDQELANADLFYKKIDDIIQARAGPSKVPYIAPYTVYINRDEREEIVVNQYTDDLDQLIVKLINGSGYVANLSGKYLEHKLGSWLFSGSKNYVLTINPPSSIIMDINNSKSLITDMLSSFSEETAAAPGSP
jgi:hypothetical protein